jgi:biotin carboxyl carrier protein
MKTENSSTTSKSTPAASVPPVTSAAMTQKKTHSAETVKAPHIDARRFGLKSKNLVKGPSLDEQLLNVVTSNADNSSADRALRSIAIKATQAVGAAHVLRENELWTMSADQVTGRVPKTDALIKECGEQLEEFATSDSPNVLQLDCLEGLPVVFLALGSAKQPELLLVTLKDSTDLTSTFTKLRKVVAALQLVRRNTTLNNSMWQLNSLAAIMELVGKIEKSDTVKSATEMASNELVSLLGCDSVAIALFKKGKLKLNAISGIAKIDRASRTCRDYQQALYESVIRDQQGTYPAQDTDNGHLLLAHKQLASTVQSQSALSQPLSSDEDEDAIGSWIFTGPQSQLASEHFARFIDTATPHISGAIDLLRRAEKSRWKRVWSLFTRKTKLFTRLMIPIFLVAFVLLMYVPVTYKVRCNCTVEPVLRRFAVAAFDGLVESGFVEPGDLVEKDQVLAEIDGRTIRWELLGVSSERKQSMRQREIELADRNIPKTLLAELENRRLTAAEEVLKYKQDHLKIRSPISGVVLSGSLERAEAASVTTGQVLFEIGPIDPVKIEIAIPADDATQVKKGHPVTVWIEGQEDRPLESVIERIHPRSEIRDALNIFVAEIRFENPEETLRPGMKGVVRIDAEKRSLGWSLFHKPINYLRSRLTWW